MDNPYSILFEPVPIGPVTTPNRFFQVPHCNGMGHRMPRALAAMRGIKAEGGWGVVCTEETEIHHSSDLSPNVEGRIWDDGDVPAPKPDGLSELAIHDDRRSLFGLSSCFHPHIWGKVMTAVREATRCRSRVRMPRFVEILDHKASPAHLAEQFFPAVQEFPRTFLTMQTPRHIGQWTLTVVRLSQTVAAVGGRNLGL